MYTLTGTLKVKSDEQQVSEKFKKREFVIADNSSQYPQFISLQLTQDKCSAIDQYKVGEELKVFFNLRGREWTDNKGQVKYFNSLEAWKIEAAGASTSGGGSSEPSFQSSASSSSADVDDLPF
jgi:hypothetical protein